MRAAAALSAAGPTPLMLSLAAPVRALAQPGAGAGAKAGEAGADQALLAGLEPRVLAELERFRTPGVSVAAVRDGQLLLARGYGLRRLEGALPMTAQTVQPIGSITKSFTVAVIASLVREGRMRWDQPVRELLPGFALASDELSARVTVRDLLTHRTGVARHDNAWFGSPFTREQLVQRLRHLETSAGLRERFQYNNFMFMAAGYLAGVVAGSTWEALVRERLFLPLGMGRSGLELASMLTLADRGTGYTAGEDGRPVEQPYQALDAMGPAGSINSSAEDMVRYLSMLCAAGRHDSRTLIHPGDLAEMTGPQMIANTRSRWPELAPLQYGMGFFVGSYRGERFFEHGGALPGSSSRLIVLPEQRLGIFVSANLRRSAVTTTLPYLLLDTLLRLPLVDWSARLDAEAATQRAATRAAATQAVAPRVLGTKPARGLEAYAGDYEHGAYGRLAVRLSGDVARPLALAYNGMRTLAAHHHYEVFQVPASATDLLDQTRLHFIPDAEGDIESVLVRMEPTVAPIVFRRLPDAALSEPQRLARFVGVYAAPGGHLVIALRSDGVLTMEQGEQAPLVLQAVAGTRFRVLGPGDRQLQFRLPPAAASATGANALEVADAVAVLSSRGNLLALRLPR